MTLFIGFHLLDRQVLDRDGQDVGKVDDVELTIDESGPRIKALLVGPLALGPRLGGWLGTCVTGIASRLHPDSEPGPIRIPYDLVQRVDAAIVLSVRRELLPEPQVETWLRQHLIGRIPGNEVDGG
jgi:sporulation protein YlmC with PRC-barrel domain